MELKEKIDEIITFSKNNNMRVSRFMVDDILSDDHEISKADRASAFDEILKAGISIEANVIEDYDESYDSDSFIPSDVNVTPRNHNVSTILDRLNFDEIDLSPNFQRRKDLWSTVKQSQLIESLMLKIPLPVFYFDATQENKWKVVDGLQRLSAFKNYLSENSKKTFEGLEYLKEFNGKTFSELPRKYIRRIKEATLLIYTIEKGTPEAVVFNIFKRINTGGLILNPQEIRQALYQGNGTEFIKELAMTEEFKAATDNSILPDRMLDNEFVTRYVAFTELDLDKYDGNIDNFLILGLKKINQYSQEQLIALGEEFRSIMTLCYDIFGKYAFRKVSLETKRRSPINKAIFEIWSHCLYNLTESQRRKLRQNKDIVRETYWNLLEDKKYSTVIKAGDKSSMLSRINMTKTMLEELLNDKQNEAL